MDNPEKEQKNSVKQEQIHDILFNRELGWQEIIYDLINTEQLDPWDIDIIILTERYLEKLSQLEEADFFVSSKVLLAASLLLRIKSDILLSRHIKSIDEILFGKKEQAKTQLERIELDEEIPELIPRSPMPRFRKVTLKELMESLNKAIITENRRIKKEIVAKNVFRESSFSLPSKKFSIKDKIVEIFRSLTDIFREKKIDEVIYSEFAKDKEQKISSLLPLLYLEDQKKVWLEQKEHFGDIHIWLHDVFFKNHSTSYENLKDAAESENFSEEDFENADSEEN
jgi:segregation and condensation protein A